MPRSKAFEDLMKKAQPYIAKVGENKEAYKTLDVKAKLIEKLVAALKKIK